MAGFYSDAPNPWPALQADGLHAAGQSQPRQPLPPASRSHAAGDHWRPGGPAQSPANTPQRCARATFDLDPDPACAAL